MNITIVGSGYVGLVAGVCFAEMGNKVICVDNDEQKVEHLKEGIIPIYEPGLSEMITNCQKRGNIFFTTSLAEGISDSEIIFIAVGTPMGDDGSADLKYVKEVAKSITGKLYSTSTCLQRNLNLSAMYGVTVIIALIFVAKTFSIASAMQANIFLIDL